jgi:phosphatidylserine decarboxylase
MMPFASQVVPFLLVLAAGAVVPGLVWGPWAALPCLVAAAFVLFFFRDPERVPPLGEGLVIAPADGRVTAVERRDGGAMVSIFLSVFNCHINRSPVTGVVQSARHTPGRFRPAWDPRVETDNERNHLVIRAADGDYGVTQIAGILARRIVCSVRPGDSVSRGDRIGLIQFGSRTDLHLPAGVDPVVRPGDRVRGARTVIARRRAAPASSGTPLPAAGSGP